MMPPTSTATATAAAAPPNDQEIVATYRRLQSEMQGLVQKLTQIEMDRNEHRLVEETLTPLDPDRRAFRLVGEVLVERTVREVLPTVRDQRGRLDEAVQALKTQLDAKQRETAAWKTKYNIKTQEEVEAVSRQ